MTPNKLPPLPEPLYSDDDLRVIVQDWDALDADQLVSINLARECLQHREALRQSQSLPAGPVAGLVGYTIPLPDGTLSESMVTFTSSEEFPLGEEVKLYTHPQPVTPAGGEVALADSLDQMRAALWVLDNEPMPVDCDQVLFLAARALRKAQRSIV